MGSRRGVPSAWLFGIIIWMSKRQVFILVIVFLAIMGVLIGGRFFLSYLSKMRTTRASDFIYVESAADVNGDHVIDASDIGIIVSQFGKSGNSVRGDVSGDGKVDQIDLDFAIKNLTARK